MKRKPKLELDFTDKLIKIRSEHEIKLVRYWMDRFKIKGPKAEASYEKVNNYSVEIYTVKVMNHIVFRRYRADMFSECKWRYELYDLEGNIIK